MPELLGNGAGALTANGYVATCQLGPATRVRQLFFQVLNADAVVQYWKPQPGNPDAGPVLELLERRITEGSLVTVDNAAGARWRSAVPGSPATILGELDYATDPLPAFQQVTQVILTLSVLDNGVLKGAESAIDFTDSSSVTWTVTDVPGTKVTVAATVTGAGGPAGGDLGGTYPNPTVTGLQGRALASTAPSTNQVIAWSGTQWAPATQLVTSVFGRTGAVVATSGDYTAAQVTNAADKSSASAQVFTGSLSTGPASTTFSGSQSAGVFISTGGQITSFGAVGYTLLNSGLTTDTVNRFNLNYAGQMLWGAGGSTAVDAALSRSAAGRMQFFGAGGGSIRLDVISAAVSDVTLATYITGDTQPRLATQISAAGCQLRWGSGSAGTDCVLDRSAANTLIASNTGLLSSSPSVGLGYTTGAGGAVTQATSFNTGVTLNKICGVITIFTSATTAGTVSTFTVTNSTVGANDVVVVSWGTGGAANNGLLLTVSGVAAGSFTITWEAVSSNASATRTINFAVIKGSNS